MQNTGNECSIRTTAVEHLQLIRRRSRAARGDYRYINGRDDRAGELEIVAGARFGIELLPQGQGLLVFTSLSADDLTTAVAARLAP